jgi:hypothetical protein
MVSIVMIDIVTVVFQEELDILQKQARSIDLYVKNIGRIIVVVNQDDDLTQSIDPAWWGTNQHCVEVVPRSSFGTEWSSNGWVSQQALKLLSTATATSEWAVILDAKTIFVNHFKQLDARPAIGQLPIYPVFEPSRSIACDLFDIDLQSQLGPGGVPFVINTAQTRDMIVWIQHQVQQPFADWFQQQGRLTEFILYSAWIQRATGSLDSIYNLDCTDISPCNLCHSEVARFEQKYQAMSKATTVSIHRHAWSQLSATQQRQYQDFLSSRGIE